MRLLPGDVVLRHNEHGIELEPYLVIEVGASTIDVVGLHTLQRRTRTRTTVEECFRTKWARYDRNELVHEQYYFWSVL